MAAPAPAHDTAPARQAATTARAPGIRARARAELTREILATARRQLAVDGAAGLSLRAVARELGMVSSAVYRYVPSRDDLLTRLIVEAYDSLGAAAEEAEAAVPRDDLAGRFVAVGRAVRRWALAHEHEYALIFGSPVPGYRAPQDTVGPATRIPTLLLRILTDGAAEGRVLPASPVSPELAAAIEPLRSTGLTAGLPDEVVIRGLMSWTYLFGAVSFDLFGHRHQVVADERAVDHPFFDAELERLVALVGLA
jgi:AcrR family transcriptional regulator